MGEQTSAAPVRRTRGGPDRVTVVLFSLTAFLLVFALLLSQLTLTGSKAATHASVLIRRIYQTTVVERVPAGARGAGSTSTSQSVSGSASPLPAAPLTRTS